MHLQRLKDQAELKQEEYRLQYVINTILKDPINISLLKAGQFKGRKAQPSNPEKINLVAAFRSIEPILFKAGHQVIRSQLKQVQEINKKLKEERREPFEREIEIISAYQNSLMKQSDQVMNTIEAQNASPRKLTSLERGQIRLKFIQMNEKPENFLLDNRYLERIIGNKILTGKTSNLKKL